jgi:hypothetical protein
MGTDTDTNVDLTLSYATPEPANVPPSDVAGLRREARKVLLTILLAPMVVAIVVGCFGVVLVVLQRVFGFLC